MMRPSPRSEAAEPPLANDAQTSLSPAKGSTRAGDSLTDHHFSRAEDRAGIQLSAETRIEIRTMLSLQHELSDIDRVERPKRASLLKQYIETREIIAALDPSDKHSIVAHMDGIISKAKPQLKGGRPTIVGLPKLFEFFEKLYIRHGGTVGYTNHHDGSSSSVFVSFMWVFLKELPAHARPASETAAVTAWKRYSTNQRRKVKSTKTD